MSAQVLDVGDLLDTGRLRGFQYLVVVLCVLVTFIDGFDVQAISYVAPAIIHSWHISPAAFSPAIAAGVLGTVLGTLCLGPVADRAGRRWVIIVCTAAVGLSSFATMAADGILSLTILRFITGLGIGGAYPNAIALTSEYSSRRTQALLVVIAVCGNSMGGVIGGAVSASLISTFGWKAVFFAGGVLALALVPLLIWLLPESLRFLLIKQRPRGQIAAIVRRLAPSITPDTQFLVTEDNRPGLPIRHLFTDGRSRMTLLIWLMWFMNLVGMFFVSSWLPTVANEAGLSIERAVLAGSLYHFGGIFGCLFFGRIVASVNPCAALGTFYFLGAVSIALLGTVTGAPSLVLVAALATGVCVIGAQNSSNAVTARLYPTFIGSTGIGWAFGIGRIGSMVGPVIGGILLSLKLGTEELFLVASAPGVVAALAAFALMRNANVRAAQPAVAVP
jgi:AAHS family 4-hydroxybenzoate transporter-like MFS transporter